MKKTIISVKNISKNFQIYKKEPGLAGSFKSLFFRKFETIKAINNISFEINEGEIIGFIGKNGAGKTTTLKILSGLLYPTSGKVSILGFNPWDRKHDFQKQFALIMGQKNQLWWDLPAIESFLLNKAIYEIDDKTFTKTLNKLSNLLDVNDILKVQVRKLSLGQRMKCELIAALLHNPKILFLDEPTIGLDVIMQKTFRDFIKNYNQEFGATTILTSHYMDDVKELCKRVIIIDQGIKVFDGSLDKIIKTYAHNKILTFTFANKINEKDLLEYGIIKSINDNQVILVVKRENATRIAGQILNKYKIHDLNIEEAPIEAIIREIFSKNNSKNE